MTYRQVLARIIIALFAVLMVLVILAALFMSTGFGLRVLLLAIAITAAVVWADANL